MSNIELKIVPTREMFYSEATSYGIYACEPARENKLIKINKYGNFSLKGNTVRLTLDKEYNAKVAEKEDKKYGTYYEIVSLFEDIPTDKKKQKSYLLTLLTPNQVNAIYQVYPNEDIIQLIKEDKFDVSKVKGIGKKTYNKIKDKLIENLEFQQAYEFLSGYGVTNNLIIKLVKHFKSANLLIKKMKENPYSITAVSGVGYKKADTIAMSMGYDPVGEFRIVAAIQYVVEEESNQGHTYCEIDKVVDTVYEMIGVDESIIAEQIVDTNEIIVLNGKLALKKNYNAEKYIAERLKELVNSSQQLNFNVEEFIQEQEDKHGITLTDQQKSLFTNIQKYNMGLLTGYAGCVDMHTEYFNGYEWRKISEYQEGDKVLQYNENGTAELITPLAYHKLPETKMTLIKTDLGSINQCLSDEHTVVYRTSKGHIAKKPFYEIAKRHNEIPQGFYGKFITHFTYNGEGIGLTDEQIRVMVMVIADGYFKNETNLCRVNIKKKRKHERIRILLENAKIPYNELKRKDGYIQFTFTAPIRQKEFDSVWYYCSQHQLQVICDEVLHWDGSVDQKGRQRFSANVKENAEFVQFAFSATGHRATLSERDRTGQSYKDSQYIRKTKEYNVQIAQGKWVSLFARTVDKKTPLVEVAPEDGFKYCFTVPSEMWIMRREGRICVTGNCGKSQMVALLIDLLNKLNVSYRLLSPTGKAAKVLSNYTGCEAETIHRAIGLGERTDQESQKVIEEEFVIVDEVSMLDVQLCAKLLKKCVHKNVRILFIGDDAQIGSVSAGNVLYDCIQSRVIPLTKLDIVFRQKEGGILDIATKVRQREKFLNNNDWGIKEYGNNCTIACVPQDKMEGGYKYFYKELLKEYNPEDIMVLSPTKKSNLGTIMINKTIQELVNPKDENKNEKEYGFDKTIVRENDYVINTKNSYKMLNVYDQEVDIVNGDTGIVKKVDLSEEEIVVDFGFDTIPIPFGKLNQLLHSWCITKHKSQGSGSPAVIIVMDKAHKFQINTNLFYTAITRSKEKLVILTQAETINFALKKVVNLQRKTFLREFLVSE